jgi:hypothetical protein
VFDGGVRKQGKAMAIWSEARQCKQLPADRFLKSSASNDFSCLVEYLSTRRPVAAGQLRRS